MLLELSKPLEQGSEAMSLEGLSDDKDYYVCGHAPSVLTAQHPLDIDGVVGTLKNLLSVLGSVKKPIVGKCGLVYK